MTDARDIARMLGERAPQLAAELLPHGKRDGQEWRCGSIAGEPGRSLAVHLTGGKAGVWSDFAAGTGGDALDLVTAVLFGGDVKQALAWSRRWLGLGTAPTAAQQRAAPAPRDAEGKAEAEARRRAALRMFLGAEPGLRDTPVAAYLLARGIDLAELQRQPRSLRFHPSIWNVESRLNLPCMLAAVTDGAGRHIATHRTWLSPDRDGVWRKAWLQNPKMSLGGVAGGCIRLWRGSSGKSLAQAPAGEVVVIAEGIETGLSIVVACPELRVISAVSLANMARLALPPAIGTVIIAADDDGDNASARRALDRAVQGFLSEGRAVRIARPPSGKDFNDTLQAVDA